MTSPRRESPRAIYGDARLHQRLQWLIAARLLAVTSFAVSAFLLDLTRPTESGTSPDFLYTLTGLAYVLTLGHLAFMRWGGRWAGAHAWLQMLGDLVFTTGLVFFFGAVTSPASVLYFLVIIVGTWLLPRPAGLLLATFAWILYTVTAIGLFTGAIAPPVTPAAVGAAPPLAPALWLVVYNLTAHGLGFFAVAALTTRLVGEVRVTERELAARQADLAALKVVHRDVIQSVPSGLLTTDPSGRITSVNRAAVDIMEIAETQLVGAPITGVGLFTESVWASWSGDSSARSTRRQKVTVEAGGRHKPVGFSVSAITSETGEPTGHIVIFQDLTEWQTLQEELRLKDRMAAVGEMAAGIAHEIGNPLAALSGSVQMLAGRTAEDNESRPLLDIIRKESQRLDRTIKGFLRFARPRERSAQRFDVAALLAENVALLRNSSEVADGHTLDLDLDPERAEITADPDQVAQIFWNLARNALRAMPGEGRLWVRGRLRPPSYFIEFEDTGRGMTEDQRAKLFQPFQSFFDEGTGIGMAIVYRIVQEHGGRLSVDSRPGEGSRVVVELPTGGPSVEAAP